VPLDQPTGVAFSPDGLHYATVDSDSLRVYATSDKDADGATPVLKRPCECTRPALASSLMRAAAVLNDGRGFVIFDLKDDSRSRVFESFEGARGEKVISGEKLALSPSGRYLALYADEDEDEGRHSKLLVLDTESGEPVKIYDDDAASAGSARDITFGPTGNLNMLISDVAFGSTGDLAIVGKRLGRPEGRAVIWRLNADAHPPNTLPSLNSDSFVDYEVVPQEKDVSAVAPGADATYFATDKGVWKRPAWQTRFDSVARIPTPANASISAIERMAFRDGGKSLALARGFLHRSSDGETMKETVEVWDAEGHKGRVEAFHTAAVVHAGFEPGGRLVAALTEYDSKNLTDGPMGENRAHRLRVYQADTGSEVASTEPTPEDLSAFYVGPNAAQIVTLSGETAKVWDVWAKDEAKRKRAASFGGEIDRIEAVGLSPGGRFLALAGRDDDEVLKVIIYRSDGGDYMEVKRFGLDRGTLMFYEGLMLSADGRRLVVLHGGDKNSLSVYDDGVENAALRERLGDLKDVGVVALSANGRYLAVSDQLDITNTRLTGRARLFDLSESSWETLLDGELVTSIAFSPDGAYVGLGSDEGVLHVFETAKPKGDARDVKEEVARLRHAGEVTAVAFSDDGRYVATASSQPQPYRIGEAESYPVRVWLLRPAELIAESERRLGQVKTPER
jgi:WD40 repeat protein